MADLERRIRRNLAAFERRAAAGDGTLRRAAVAVCVLECDTEPRLLIGKRVARGLNPGSGRCPAASSIPARTP